MCTAHDAGSAAHGRRRRRAGGRAYLFGLPASAPTEASAAAVPPSSPTSTTYPAGRSHPAVKPAALPSMSHGGRALVTLLAPEHQHHIGTVE